MTKSHAQTQIPNFQSWIRFKEGTTAEKHVERVKEANDGKIVINGAELTHRILEGKYFFFS